jgi:hypothetical protein
MKSAGQVAGDVRQTDPDKDDLAVLELPGGPGDHHFSRRIIRHFSILTLSSILPIKGEDEKARTRQASFVANDIGRVPDHHFGRVPTYGFGGVRASDFGVIPENDLHQSDQFQNP